jgi:hypothetical protein
MLIQCSICKTLTSPGAIHSHHTSYSPEMTIDICANCHNIIHHPPQDLKDLELLCPELRHFILLNHERVEREQWSQEETQREYAESAKENSEQEMKWRWAFQQGFPTYDIKVAKDIKDIEKLGEMGFEHLENFGDSHIFRRPKKIDLLNLPTKNYDLCAISSNFKKEQKIIKLEKEVLSGKQYRIDNAYYCHEWYQQKSREKFEKECAELNNKYH